MKKIAKELARFLVFALWSGILSLIILLFYFFTGKIEWYRLLDVLSIAFFISLAAETACELEWKGDEFRSGAIFVLCFLLAAVSAPLVGLRYPPVTMGDSNFSSFIFLPAAAVTIATAIVHRRGNWMERIFAACGKPFAVIGGTLLGFCFYYSVYDGIVVIFGYIAILALKAFVAAILVFLFAAILGALIDILVQINIGLGSLKKAIFDLHRLAFSRRDKT